MNGHADRSTGVPAGALGPAIPASGYLLEEIGDQLFWLTDGLYQMMFVVTPDGVIAVDAPPTLGHVILRAIRSTTRRRVSDAVYSHHHADHTGAMVLYEGAVLHADVETARLLRAAGDPNRPLPTRTFAGSARVGEGDGTLELEYHGPVHSPGNTFVYAPAHQTLMLVDVVFPGWVPFASLAVSQDVPAWLAAPSRALEYPFATFVGGHLTRLGTRDDVRLHEQYLSDLEDACRRAIDVCDVRSVHSNGDPSDPWSLFRSYLDAIAAHATEAVAHDWRGELGGVDAFTDMNAWTLAESLRLDSGHLGPFGIRD